MSADILNSNVTQSHIENIQSITYKHSQQSLDKISQGIDWELLAGSIAQRLSIYEIKYSSSNLVFVLKSIALEVMFDIPISKIDTEISDRKSFQTFLGIHSTIEIPQSFLCIEVKNALMERGLYDSFLSLLETVLSDLGNKNSNDQYNKTIDSKLDQLEEKLRRYKKTGTESVLKEDATFERESAISSKLEHFSKELEDATKLKTETGIPKLKTLDEKLKDVNQKIDFLFNKHVLKAEEEIPKPIEKASELIPEDKEKEVYKKLFDSFYNQLKSMSGTLKTEPESVADKLLKETAQEEFVSSTESKIQDDTTKKLKKIEDEIKKLYEKIEHKETIKTPEAIVPPVIKKIEEPGIEIEPENFIDLKKTKKYHIFNNTNLTEDYELGLRFYKLGFKTAFINMRADEKDENTRIATAEYFPNTFWGSVRQRSRWIAGIVFQNWKIHKWEGGLKTKYFLLRDRKALISFFGILLSNIVFLYFLLYMIGLAFNYPVPEPSVTKGTLLYYLMVVTLFLMISRVVHKFAATYNWYGFKYAALSLVRSIFDNFINLFATARALKVYKTNKKRIVWDSTEHY